MITSLFDKKTAPDRIAVSLSNILRLGYSLTLAPLRMNYLMEIYLHITL
jgi:hypothetical protein